MEKILFNLNINILSKKLEKMILFMVTSLLFILSFSVYADKPSDCLSCHADEVEHWQQSDHAKSMALANSANVIGNFNNAEVSHFSQKAKFYQKKDQYFAALTEQGVTKEYHFVYTFGFFPLQQYLVKTNKGRYQVFPFAWDAREKATGGQRWYPNYPDEDIQPADRLHWLQPMQNWNGMCADCHSDGLKRNFHANTNTFNTTWDNINVGCQSCHGKIGKDHPIKNKSPNNNQTDITFKPNFWKLNPHERIAHWEGKPRNNQFMDNCFACHALRSPITDGFVANKPFLDQFSPSLLSLPLYHVDGQIKEEVYVYGSFLQSKMYKAGVNCLDCHDKHTMKIKIQGNGLCLQCHNTQTYQQPAHLNHPIGSQGAQCVNCHMPTKRYMGVDDRRDHSLRVPRPTLTKKYGSPNVCNDCHKDKTVDWAINQVNKRYKQKTADRNALTINQINYLDLQSHKPVPLEKHLAIINDSTLNEIVRASAIMLLPNTTRTLTDQVIQPWVTSPLPLIRLATAQIGSLIPISERNKSFAKLLSDKYKAVRIHAASELLYLDAKNTPLLDSAIKALILNNDITKWRGEGGLNDSIRLMNLQQLQPAIDSLKQSINVDPYFAGAYLNLADIYRMSDNIAKEKSTLEQGIKANPKSALLHYSFGLSQIRSKQYSDALISLKTAKKLAPTNSQYAYVYYVALDNQQKSKQALSDLMLNIRHYNDKTQLIELGLYLAQKLQDKARFDKLKQMQ